MNAHENIFAVARLLPAEEQAAYLDLACRGAGERKRVEALLRGAELQEEFLVELDVPPRRPESKLSSEQGESLQHQPDQTS